MPLTTSQKQTLKAFILSDPTLSVLAAPPISDYDAIRNALNAAAAPDFWVWRTRVEKKEITEQTSQDGTTFVWAGNGFIGRSVGELECWNQLFNSTLTVNPSLANVRQAFQDIFSGTGNAASNRTHLLAVARRKASLVEKLLATGTGSTGSPATMGFEGTVNLNDVNEILNG